MAGLKPLREASGVRALLRWVGWSTVALTVVLIAVELAFGGFRGWLAERPLFVGVVGGLLTLVIGAVGLERLVAGAEERLREQQWERLRRVGLRALGASAGQVIDGMNWLLLGQAPATYETGVFGDAPSRLRAIFAQRQLAPREHDDLGALEGQDLERRLVELAGERDWQRIAIDVLDVIKWRHRSQIAEWATLLLGSEETIALLDRLAQLNDAIGSTQQPLRALRRGDGVVDPVRDAWFGTLAEAIALREDVYVAAGDARERWARFRRALPEPEQRQLTAHDRIAGARARLRVSLPHTGD